MNLILGVGKFEFITKGKQSELPSGVIEGFSHKSAAKMYIFLSCE